MGISVSAPAHCPPHRLPGSEHVRSLAVTDGAPRAAVAEFLPHAVALRAVDLDLSPHPALGNAAALEVCTVQPF